MTIRKQVLLPSLEKSEGGRSIFRTTRCICLGGRAGKKGRHNLVWHGTCETRQEKGGATWFDFCMHMRTGVKQEDDRQKFGAGNGAIASRNESLCEKLVFFYQAL